MDDRDTSGWKVEPELPPIRRRAPKTESRDAVTGALDGGVPVSRAFDDPDEARRVGRRLRNAGRKLGAVVTVRYEGQDDGSVKVIFTAERPTDGG